MRRGNNGVQTKIDIGILQEQMRTIKENDLAHLTADVKEVKGDIKEVKGDIKEVSEKFEARFDKLSTQIAKFAGGIAVLVVIAQYIIKLLTGS